MLGGNRLRYIALGIALVLAFPALGQAPIDSQGGPQEEAEQPAIETPSVSAPIVRTEPAKTNTEPDESFFGLEAYLEAYLKKEDSVAQWIMAGFGALATGISIFAVILLKRTLKATRDAVKEAERATKVAGETLVESRKSSERQLRAYVSIAKAVFKWKNDRVFEARITFINNGQTPAYKIQTYIRYQIAGNETDFQNAPDRFELGFGTVGPSNSSTMIVESDPLSDEEWGDIRSGSVPLYISGKIKYWDAFDRCRHTHFHTVLDDTSEILNFCPSGNDST